jgi:release factor glutamine methyltransferase
VRSWLAAATEAIGRGGGSTPALDARLLLAAALTLTPAQVIARAERPLTSTERRTLSAILDRRLSGEPVSRILGRRLFYGIELEITGATLDPRPETELVVDTVRAIVAREGRASQSLNIVDLGTGSGAILLALLEVLPSARGIGIDVSWDALRVAKRNAAALGLYDRALFRRGNWLEGFDARADFIVANPPYIRTAEIAGLPREVRDWDPGIALDGGEGGLAAYEAIAAGIPGILVPGGWLVLEIGFDQDAQVTELLTKTEHFGPIEVGLDLAGLPRCVAAKSLVGSPHFKKPIGNPVPAG